MSRTALDGAHSQHHDSLTNANFSTEPQCPLLCLRCLHLIGADRAEARRREYKKMSGKTPATGSCEVPAASALPLRGERFSGNGQSVKQR